jgi:hypothetical protein
MNLGIMVELVNLKLFRVYVLEFILFDYHVKIDLRNFLLFDLSANIGIALY